MSYVIENAYRVTEEMVGVHPLHPTYPLLPGDLLTKSSDGSYMKHTGIAIGGFTLSPEQAATLEKLDGSQTLEFV